MPRLTDVGYTVLADAAGRILAERGDHLLLSPTGDDPHTEAETLRDMVGQNVDGLILVPSAVDKALVDSWSNTACRPSPRSAGCRATGWIR